MEGESDQPITSTAVDSNALNSKDDNLSILQRANAVQEAEIKRLQLELNESQVKHGKEVYWLRLELDSARRDKEAAEDRMAELYDDVQEILSPTNHSDDTGFEGDAATAKDASEVICTEPDYVVALHDRLSAYERSVEVLNRQIDILKTSSEAVVTNMKQEVSDLMEEKSLMEMDLLNQISNLDNVKRNLEVELMVRSSRQNVSDEKHGVPQTETSIAADDDDHHSFHSTPSPATLFLLTSSQSDVSLTKTSADSTKKTDDLDTTIEQKSSKGVQEVSFRSTAMTVESSFTNINIASPHTSAFLTETEDMLELQRQYSMEAQSLREEVTKYQTEAERIGKENQDLQEKITEITKDLMFTKSSANVALALDKIKTDRAETLAHLDRIAVLWDRADSTIQILEGILSEVQPGTTQPGVGKLVNKEDQDQLLSTLETAALVHGQIKMTLMHIELTFRNHLASIQNDSIHDPQQNDATFSSRLDTVRSETLVVIAEAEDKWKLAIEHLEKQILVKNKSTNDAIKLQLEELQKAQATQGLLEQELQGLKTQLPLDPEQSKEGIPVEDITDQKLPSTEKFSRPTSTGIIVSPGVLFRLQQEVLSVVEKLKEKNQVIEGLTKTIEKQRNRGAVLKKELKRMKQQANQTKIKQTQKENNEATHASSHPVAELDAQPLLVPTNKTQEKEKNKDPSKEPNRESSIDGSSKAPQNAKGTKGDQKKTLWPFLPKVPGGSKSKGSRNSTAKNSLCSEPKAPRKAHQKHTAGVKSTTNRGWSSL